MSESSTWLDSLGWIDSFVESFSVYVMSHETLTRAKVSIHVRTSANSNLTIFHAHFSVISRFTFVKLFVPFSSAPRSAFLISGCARMPSPSRSKTEGIKILTRRQKPRLFLNGPMDAQTLDDPPSTDYPPSPRNRIDVDFDY